jgi:hypothetical protein
MASRLTERHRDTSAGHTERLILTGLGPDSRVNVAVRTEGAELHEGGIVLERSFANALSLPVGATLRFAGPNGPWRSSSARAPASSTASSGC